MIIVTILGLAFLAFGIYISVRLFFELLPFLVIAVIGLGIYGVVTNYKDNGTLVSAGTLEVKNPKVFNHAWELADAGRYEKAEQYIKDNKWQLSRSDVIALEKKIARMRNKKAPVVENKKSANMQQHSNKNTVVSIEKKTVISDYQRMVNQIAKKEFMTARSILRYSNNITAQEKAELAEMALAKVKPIPAADHKANLWGYQLLNELAPSEYYTNKVKHYSKAGRTVQVASTKKKSVNTGNGKWTVVVNGKSYYYTQKQWGGDHGTCYDYASVIAKVASYIKKSDYITCISPTGRKKHYDSKLLVVMR